MPFREVDADVIAADYTDHPVTIDEWRRDIREF